MNRKFVITLMTSALAFTTPAFADEAAPAAGASAANAFSDIVVTARRREESSLKVPVSVTAFGAETLRTKSINAQEDLAAHTPGLSLVSGNAQRSDGNFFIRGQGQTYGSQPGVITYMNEVPAFNISYLGTTAQFFDLSNIQVLKGPQGTLFGRSTTGGAVLLTSQRPTNDLGGNLQVSYGNYNAINIQGAVNVPIIKDKVLLRVAGDFTRRKGFTTSLASGQDLDDKHRESWRVSLLVKPVDGIENLTIVSGQDVNEHGGSTVLAEFNPDWTTSVNFAGIGAKLQGAADAFYAPGKPLANPGTYAFLSGKASLFTGYGTQDVPLYQSGNLYTGALLGVTCNFNPVCTGQRVGEINSLVGATNAELARVGAGGSIRLTAIPQRLNMAGVFQNITNTTTFRQDGAGVLGDVTIKNIFSTNRVTNPHADWELSGVGGAWANNGLNASNGTLVPYTAGSQDFLQNFTDEFQIQGHKKILDWTVGYYYSFQKVPSTIGALFGTFNNATNNNQPIPASSGQFAFNKRASDKGVYAQGTLHPFEGASITAGIRRSNYTQSQDNAVEVFTGGTYVPGALVPNPYVNQAATSYNFAADYKPMDGMLVYATTRRGFKPGGVNPAASVAFPEFKANFEPEIVTDYEAGVKYAWRGPVAGRVSAAVYDTEYSGIQRNATYALPGGAGVFTQVENAAQGRIQGFELESEFRYQKLTVGLNAAYTKAHYTTWEGCGETNIWTGSGNTCAVGDIANVAAPFTNTPKFTYSISAKYLVIDEAAIGQVSVSGNWYHQSFDVVDDNYIQDPQLNGGQKAYGLLNLRVDWNNVVGKPIDLFLNATNVANKVYKVGTADLYKAIGYVANIYGEPRMVSGGVRVHF